MSPSRLNDPEVERRLRDETIIWLITVAADGTPVPSPVAFYWDGSSFIVYSYANVPRVRNIRHRPLVSLHLNSTPTGDGVVVLSGVAVIDLSLPPAHEHPGYAAKHREGIERKGGPEFSRRYRVPIRITPVDLRRSGDKGWTFTDLSGMRPVRTRAKWTAPEDRIPIASEPGPTQPSAD